MADLEVKFHDDRFEIISQVFSCAIHDTWENRKVWFVILRSLRSPKTGKPFFSYQGLADAFGYQARQNINNFIREYEACDENFFEYLRHKRKVDPMVVAAVREELRRNVLIKSGELRIQVNQQLGRRDLTSANIRAALEQIPCTLIRQTVLRELDQGALHPKEEYVLAELFAVLDHDDAMNTGLDGRSFAALEAPPIRNTAQEPEKEKKHAEERENGTAHDDSENVANVSDTEEETSWGNSEGLLNIARNVSGMGSVGRRRAFRPFEKPPMMTSSKRFRRIPCSGYSLPMFRFRRFLRWSSTW